MCLSNTCRAPFSSGCLVCQALWANHLLGILGPCLLGQPSCAAAAVCVSIVKGAVHCIICADWMQGHQVRRQQEQSVNVWTK
eukprot:1139077-Pelagomonas_calceolata.AAC.9